MMSLTAMLARLHSLSQSQACVVLAVAGAITGWTFAPYNWWFVSLLSFPLWLVLLEPVQGRAAYGRGWCFGFGFFLSGLYWIANAMLLDLASFWWVMPIAIVVLPIYLANFFAFAGYATQRWGGTGVRRAVFFAAALSLLEWVRGHALTGFPWNLPGYIWVDVPFIRAQAAVYGIYGLTLWTLLLAAALSLLLRVATRQAGTLMLAGLIVFNTGVYFWTEGQPLQIGPSVALRLVQPNISQSLKLDPNQREQSLQRMLALTALPGRPQLVLWPESAVGWRLEEHPEIRARIATALPEGAALATGAIRRQVAGLYFTYHNSAQLMDRDGVIRGAYDKQHLVPFGEFIPLRGLVSLPIDAVASTVDFTAGVAPEALEMPGIPAFSPLVCYDVIFPATVINDAQPHVRWMLNVTNDGWYGLSNGPYQHFAMTRFRAIEEGVPLVRVANSGISAVVDARGQIVASLPLEATGNLDISLKTDVLATPYSRFNDWPFFCIVAVLLLVTRMKLSLKKK